MGGQIKLLGITQVEAILVRLRLVTIVEGRLIAMNKALPSKLDK